MKQSHGRLVRLDTQWVEEFFLEDHLGNIRVVFADVDGDFKINPDPNGADLRQVIQGYFPFGLAHKGEEALSSYPPNSLLFNGKELQDEIGLGWYDYGARMMDPSLGRWNGIDALAENYFSLSPYNYSFNNPINYIDPDGNSPVSPQDGIKGRVRYAIFFTDADKSMSGRITEKNVVVVTFEVDYALEEKEDGSFDIKATTTEESIGIQNSAGYSVSAHFETIDNEGNFLLMVNIGEGDEVERSSIDLTLGNGKVGAVSGSYGTEKKRKGGTAVFKFDGSSKIVRKGNRLTFDHKVTESPTNKQAVKALNRINPPGWWRNLNSRHRMNKITEQQITPAPQEEDE